MLERRTGLYKRDCTAKQAEDAVLVDSSHMTIEEVVAAIVKLCH